MKKKWLLYGANGYTGNLIAHQAKKLGLTPVLGGRNRLAIETLAKELGFESDVFACEEANEVSKSLNKYSAVLHCAGPFMFTSKIMTDACAMAKCHYLDITGEIGVLESLLKQKDRFQKAGIAVLPGVGFDVVPTDCVAAQLKAKLPGATSLILAFQATGGASRGTTSTMIEGMDKGSCERQGGKIVPVPLASKTRTVRFKDKEKFCVQIPWGDVASAFYSTSIPHIEVYTPASPGGVKAMRLLGFVKPVLGLAIVKKGLKRLAGNSGAGPSPDVRSNSYSRVWGEVSDGKGNREELRIQTPNGYDLTVDSALLAVQKVIAGNVGPGSWTPSQAFGAEYVFELPGVKLL